jgi:hypothetical protein
MRGALVERAGGGGVVDIDDGNSEMGAGGTTLMKLKVLDGENVIEEVMNPSSFLRIISFTHERSTLGPHFFVDSRCP